MASQEEKLKELLERLKRLGDKQADIERRLSAFEEAIKSEEPDE